MKKLKKQICKSCGKLIYTHKKDDMCLICGHKNKNNK